MMQNQRIVITNEDGNFIGNVYDGDHLVIYQPFNPATGKPMITEEEARSVIDFILTPPSNTQPTYEELKKELESTQNELLIAKGVI